MAEFVGVKYYLLVNTVDLSDHVEDMKWSLPHELLEYVTANTTGTNLYKKRLIGVGDGQITVTFSDDFASGEVDATLRALIGNAGFVVVSSFVGATAGAANPQLTMTCVYGDYTAGGPAGQRMQKQVTFMLANGTQPAIVAA